MSTAGRRGQAAAWAVLIAMSGTTMTYNVYHAVTHGQMPAGLAFLYGVVPLFISLCISEIIGAWKDAPWWAWAGAFGIMIGAMALSAGATGSVVRLAAPAHMSWLFGLVLDGASLLALQVLLSGPRRLSATQKQAAETARQAELAAERAARQAAETDLAAVRAELAGTVAKAETLARKLETATARKRRTATGRKPGTATGRKPASATGPAAAPDEAGEEAPADLDSEARVLWYLDRGYSASRAGIRAGLTDSRGRQIARLRQAAPRDTVYAEGETR